MRKNEKGFFLAETIIVVALITAIMAFVFPNVSKLYDNYKTRIKYYDQTEDMIFLSELYKANKDKIDEETEGCCGDTAISTEPACQNNNHTWMPGTKEFNNISLINLDKKPGTVDTIYKEYNIYIVSYMELPSDSDNYPFNRYLKRIKKSNNDVKAYRLIGEFKIASDNNNSIDYYRYANIKIVTDRICQQ